MKTWSLFLTTLVLSTIAVPAAAQPSPTAPKPGSVYPAPATVPKDKLPAVVQYARGAKGVPKAPDKFPTPTNLDTFAGQAAAMRRDLDNAALVLAALQSDDMKGMIGEGERAQLVEKMTADVNNANAWLDKMGTAFVDTLPKPAPIGQPKYEGPSIGLPSRPTRPAYVPRTAAGVIAEKGFPGGPAASLHPVTSAISRGWTVGAWMGNEVMIKEELRQSWKAQDDLKKAQADWDKNVKPQWEENRRREREDRARADAERQRMAPTYSTIFQSLFTPRPFIVPQPPKDPPKTTTSSLPSIPSSFGSAGGYGGLGGYGPYGGGYGPYGGGMGSYGYSGNRFGSTAGGNGPYGGGGGMGNAGYAGGAGMGNSPFRR